MKFSKHTSSSPASSGRVARKTIRLPRPRPVKLQTSLRNRNSRKRSMKWHFTSVGLDNAQSKELWRNLFPSCCAPSAPDGKYQEAPRISGTEDGKERREEERKKSELMTADFLLMCFCGWQRFYWLSVISCLFNKTELFYLYIQLDKKTESFAFIFCKVCYQFKTLQIQNFYKQYSLNSKH